MSEVTHSVLNNTFDWRTRPRFAVTQICFRTLTHLYLMSRWVTLYCHAAICFHGMYRNNVPHLRMCCSTVPGSTALASSPATLTITIFVTTPSTAAVMVMAMVVVMVSSSTWAWWSHRGSLSLRRHRWFVRAIWCYMSARRAEWICLIAVTWARLNTEYYQLFNLLNNNENSYAQNNQRDALTL